VPEAHVILFAVAPDGEVEPLGERVDDGNADAVEATGHLVGIVVRRVLELTAGVELGHDDFRRGNAFLGMDAGRDAAAIILDRHGAVGIERDQDAVAMAGERLVDRIVRDLEHHVVEARTIVGVADIHARPFAHRIEAFQNLDGVRAVGVLTGGRCHGEDIEARAGKSRAHARVRARGLLTRRAPGPVSSR
jgi:hypothetical protein